MNSQERGNQVGGGIFMVGLGLLFLTRFWWPGIMFVIGASILGRTIAEGRPWQSATSAFIMIGIGVIFWLPGLSIGALWPIILIGMGLAMLFGGNMMNAGNYGGKAKHSPDDEIY